QYEHQGPGEGFISGNGRIEATETVIATKLAGRVEEILVREGVFVQAGEAPARLQIDSLQAQLGEWQVPPQDGHQPLAAARAQISLRESDVAAAQALVAQREAEQQAATRRSARTEVLARDGSVSRQQLDDDRARARSAEAAVAAARAQVLAAQAAVEAARAQQ